MKYSANVEKLEGAKVKVLVKVASQDFETLLEDAKKKVLSEAKLNGFRDGKVPYDAFVKNFGELPIRQEMGYMAVDKTYVQVIIGEKVEAIGQPKISILKITPGEDFEYEIETDILPKVHVGDYKKYQQEFEEEKVDTASASEIDEAIEELRKMRATKSEDGADILPEITDDFAKTVGEFQTVNDLKKRVEDNINEEKKWRADERRKAKIFDKLVLDAETDVPESLIQNELLRMEEKIRADLAQMGVSFDDYLKHLKLTKPEWAQKEKATAKKQVLLQLSFNEIAKLENIKPSEQSIKNEVAHLMMHYKDIDPDRAKAYTESA